MALLPLKAHLFRHICESNGALLSWQLISLMVIKCVALWEAFSSEDASFYHHTHFVVFVRSCKKYVFQFAIAPQVSLSIHPVAESIVKKAMNYESICAGL